MNMTQMNAAGVGGGPVGGGMVMMNSGSPAMPGNNGSNSGMPPEHVKSQLNTYIYEYFLKLGHYDIARSILNDKNLTIHTRPPVKQSPGRRKDGEVNGVDADAMDTDLKDDIPDDLPRPGHLGETSTPGVGFLFEWFSIFSDLFSAHRGGKGPGGSMGPAAQYLMQHQVSHTTTFGFLRLLIQYPEHATHERKSAKSEPCQTWNDESKSIRHACQHGGAEWDDEWEHAQCQQNVGAIISIA